MMRVREGRLAVPEEMRIFARLTAGTGGSVPPSCPRHGRSRLPGEPTGNAYPAASCLFPFPEIVLFALNQDIPIYSFPLLAYSGYLCTAYPILRTIKTFLL